VGPLDRGASYIRRRRWESFSTRPPKHRDTASPRIEHLETSVLTERAVLDRFELLVLGAVERADREELGLRAGQWSAATTPPELLPELGYDGPGLLWIGERGVRRAPSLRGIQEPKAGWRRRPDPPPPGRRRDARAWSGPDPLPRPRAPRDRRTRGDLRVGIRGVAREGEPGSESMIGSPPMASVRRRMATRPIPPGAARVAASMPHPSSCTHIRIQPFRPAGSSPSRTCEASACRAAL
jgi:hypothetical protein